VVNHCISRQEAKQKQKAKQWIAALERGRRAVEYAMKLDGGAVGEQKQEGTVLRDHQRLNVAAASVRLWWMFTYLLKTEKMHSD